MSEWSAEYEARDRVVSEALSWVGTPFHHEARVKGPDGGVDCAMLLAEVYERANLVTKVLPEHYPPDWHLHKDRERYLEWVQKYAIETPDARMGDVVLFKVGRTYSHAGIVMSWPTVVHAWFESCVEKTDTTVNPQLSRAPHKFFTLKNWK